MYNDQMATLERMETNGKAIVIRPAPGLKLNRFERNQAKLHKAIDQGYQDSLQVLKETGAI
jgi:predicted patatin/cPLA2 family phospholipase